MQNFRSSLFFLLIVVGAISYLYFVDRHQPSSDELAQSEHGLFKFESAKVTSLTFTSGDQKVELEKVGSTWKIKAPLRTDADSASVEQVLTELQSMQSRRTMQFNELKSNHDSLEKSGLAPAATRIDFATGAKSEDKHVLLLGRKLFASNNVYARTSLRDDALVYLISTDSRDAVDKKLDDLRSRVVVSIETAKVDRAGVRVAGINNQPGAEYEAGKQGDVWSLQKPLTARAEGSKMNQWLGQLDGLRVKKFVTEDGSSLNQFGLNTPPYQIWIQSGDSKNAETLLIGSSVPAAKNEVYAKRLKSDGVFTLDQASVQTLLDGLPGSRDKHILFLTPAQITGVQVEVKGKTVAAKKDQDGWILEGTPSAGRAESSLITQFIDDLAGLQTLSFVNDAASDLKPYGLDKPMTKVSLVRANGDKTETIDLLLGKADKQQVFAKTSLDPFVYALPLNVTDKWPKEALDWREQNVFKVISSDKITQVTFTPTNGTPFTYDQTAPGVFTTNEPGKSVNADTAKTQVSILSQLRVVKWLGAPQSNFGLSKPFGRIDFKTDKGRTILVGADLPSGNKAAQVVGEPDCFELSQSDLKALQLSPLQEAPPASPPPAANAPKK